MKNLLPINKSTFADKSWTRSANYLFTANDSACSLSAQELPKAAMCMPTAFMSSEAGFSLVAVLGLQSDTNFFVDPDGNWTGKYVPAQYRVYPFVLARNESEEDQLVFCIDSESGLLKENSSDEAFFDNDGELTPFLKQLMEFLAEVNANNQLALSLCKQLNEFGIIKPWKIQVEMADETKNVEGLYCIDEPALHELSSEKFAELRESGALLLVYCQLLSMQHAIELVQFAQGKSQLPVDDSISANVSNGSLNFDNL